MRRLLPERAGEVAGRPGAVAHVGAGAERPARAGDDRDPRVLVVAEAGERGVEVGPHLAVDGVQRVGSVVGDRRDVPVELVAHAVSHGASLAAPTGAVQSNRRRRVVRVASSAGKNASIASSARVMSRAVPKRGQRAEERQLVVARPQRGAARRAASAGSARQRRSAVARRGSRRISSRARRARGRPTAPPRRCSRVRRWPPYSARLAMRGARPSGWRLTRSALIGGSSSDGATPSVRSASAGSLAATRSQRRSTMTAGNGSWPLEDGVEGGPHRAPSPRRRAASRCRPARSRRRAGGRCAPARAPPGARRGGAPAPGSASTGPSPRSSGGGPRPRPPRRGRAG